MTGRPIPYGAGAVGAARRVGPILLGLGASVAAGLAGIGLAWSKAAGSDLVPLQVPALVAALVGLALAGLGMAAYDVHLGRRHDALEDEAWETVMDQVADLTRSLGRSGDIGR